MNESSFEESPIEEVGFIRHGHKLKGTEERAPLEESGLSPEDQGVWREAVERLPPGTNPELRYENLPMIKEMAREMLESLPKKGTVVFSSTTSPRAHLTAEFLSRYLIQERDERGEKGFGVSFLLKPIEGAVQKESHTNILNIDSMVPTIMERMECIGKQEEFKDDETLSEYFSHEGGRTAHPMEDELLRRVVNGDLASKDSIYRTRATLLKQQLRDLEEVFSNNDGPVFFYGVGHHSNLVALDVAINNRQHYESVDEIPKPLDLWRVDRERIQRALKDA